MNSKNLVVVGLVVILLIGGVFIVFNRSRPSVEPTPAPTVVTPLPTESPAPKKQVIVSLSADKGSSESGMATMTEEDGKVSVALELIGAPAGVAQPAHIHLGKCPAVGAVKFPLTNVVDGKSMTTIDTTIDDLLGMLPLAINVHKSVPQTSVYVSCGDIVKS